METNPRITADTLRKQLPLVMQALGQHMIDHDLPPFWSIDIRSDHEVTVLVRRGTERAWLASVEVEPDAAVSEPSGTGVRTDHTVRLPDLSIRLHVVVYTDRPLTAVSSV